MPSFGEEVKPTVSCRRFTACIRSLNLRGSRNLGKITGHLSRPQFHLSLLGSLASFRTYRHLAAKVGMSKGGGKQWQTTPKNLPRMQCARTIIIHSTIHTCIKNTGTLLERQFQSLFTHTVRSSYFQ